MFVVHGMAVAALFMISLMMPIFSFLLPVYKIKKMRELDFRQKVLINIIAIMLIILMNPMLLSIYIGFFIVIELFYYYFEKINYSVKKFDRITITALQSGDVVGLNTDGDADTQEITFRVEEITSVQGDGMAPKKEQTTDAVLRETDIRRKRRVLIGRGDDCDIKLVNDRVSRHHCEILYKDGHYELHDLGSTMNIFLLRAVFLIT